MYLIISGTNRLGSNTLKVAKEFPNKKIILITKTQAEETNTKYAQGGVAGVWDDTTDSYEKHIEDTLGIKEGEVTEDGLFSWRGGRGGRFACPAHHGAESGYHS